MQKPSFSWIRRPLSIVDGSRYNILYQAIFTICSAVIVIVSSYGIVATITGHVNVVGATLVDVEIPNPEVFPFYAKPISFLMAAALGMTFSGFELARPAMRQFSSMQFSAIKMISFIVVALAAYEVLYNFSIWTAEISANFLLGVLNPDVIINQFPNPKTPWNLVFATKLSTTVFAIALYTFYFVRTLERDRLLKPE